MKFITFASVESFASWFQSLTKQPPEEDFTVRLFISSRSLLGARHAPLFEKINQFMLQKKYLGEDVRRLPVLVTAHSASDDFDRSNYKLPIYDNIIFKPFDPAVVDGKIHWAISKQDALGSEELAKQKPVSPLEMLKNVEIDRITELGFRSISSKPIESGKLARYYIPTLKPLGDDYGVYARSTSCEKIGDENRYRCSFSYFGLDQEKAKNIRSLIESSENCVEIEFEKVLEDEVGIIIVAQEKDLNQRLEAMMRASFKGVNSETFQNFFEFYSELEPVEAAKSWAENFKSVSPLILEYNHPDSTFLRAYLEKSKEEEAEEYLGISRENLARFKTLCLTSVNSSDLRHKVGDFWARDVKEPLALKINSNGQTYFITLESSQVIESEQDKSQTLQLRIKPAKAEEVAAMAEEASRIPKNTKVLLLSETIAQSRDINFWQEIKKKLNSDVDPEDIPIIVIGRTELELYDQAKEREHYDDYLVEPFDQAYLKKKIKQRVPEINLGEGKSSRACAETKETIKVGTQVDVQNFSEVSLSIEYIRELELDCFREFVIYIRELRSFEEITAKHVGSEKGNEGFINHFSIFGHDDTTNQKIRQWLNEQYVLDKQDEGGD